MKNVKRVINFKSGYVDDEGIILPDYKSIKVSNSYVKRYRDALFKIIKLQGCPRNLVDWLVDQMDEKTNHIYNTQYTRSDFLRYVAKYTKGQVKYSDGTVKNAFVELEKRSLLIKVNKGVYQVNPEYFFIGSEDERIDAIKLTMEFDKNLPDKITVETIKYEEQISGT